jgi:hypothetical protein
MENQHRGAAALAEQCSNTGFRIQPSSSGQETGEEISEGLREAVGEETRALGLFYRPVA